MVEKGEFITEEIANKIIEAGVESVTVRTLLTCDSKVGVCVKCYGSDLSTTDIVERGEVVGIVAAQSESPFVNKEEIKKMYNLLKKVFPICSTFTSNIPTYPGGYWAWAFCSEEVAPLSYYAKERAEKITKSCKIYNEDYHNARFALPNYLKELL